MKKSLLLAAALLMSSTAFACGKANCAGTTSGSVTPSVTIQGQVSNQIASEAVAVVNQGPAFSAAASTAGVQQTAAATGAWSANGCAACGPSANLVGAAATEGKAFVTTSGVGTFGAAGTASTAGQAEVAGTAEAKQGANVVKLTGSADAGNVVNVGSASGSLAGSTQTSGTAFGTSKALSGFAATGAMNFCLPGTATGTLTDVKAGASAANVTTTGGGFAGTTSAFQNANVTGSFFGKK